VSGEASEGTHSRNTAPEHKRGAELDSTGFVTTDVRAERSGPYSSTDSNANADSNVLKFRRKADTQGGTFAPRAMAA
jgi:hypothetical protein